MKPNSPSVKNAVSPLNFFALTFLLSWLIWIPLVLSHFGVVFNIPESTSIIVRLLGVLMPAVSAIILTIFTSGYDGMRNLWARLILWQVSWKW